MDPLTPATSTLTPAISHIAETAATLLRDLKGHVPSVTEASSNGMEKQRQAVRWALDTPKRLSRLVAEDRKEDAENDWAGVQTLLGRWEGVSGVEQLKRDCLQALDVFGDTCNS